MPSVLQDPHPLGTVEGIAQQHGLADPGLATQHQRTAASGPGLLAQLRDAFPLPPSTVQHAGQRRATLRSAGLLPAL